MISEQASRTFERIFKKAVLSNVNSEEDSCSINEVMDIADSAPAEFVVLTISSTVFRLLTIFHVDFEDAELNFFSKPTQFNDGVVEPSVRRDAFLEFCNICIGTMNREFQQYLPYSGMSTPYVLLQDCTSFIAALNPGLLKHYRLSINDSLVLYISLCVSEFGVIDFNDDQKSVEVDTGMLEMF